MSVIRHDDINPTEGWSSYPEPFATPPGGFRYRSMADAGGLTQFGVVHEVLEPGRGVSLHHWHEREDEFLYLLTGELTVIEGEGAAETRSVLAPGDAAAWKAGTPIGHSIFNHTEAPCSYLIMGSRAAEETGHYPGLDLVFRRSAAGTRFTHLDGTPYPRRAADRKDQE